MSRALRPSAISRRTSVSRDQAIPVAQLTFLPLAFISGIFYPLEGAPDWVVDVAHVVPLFHIVNAFDACFVSQTAGGGWSGSDLAAIAIWGVVGLAVAARRLGTEPVGGDRRLRLGVRG